MATQGWDHATGDPRPDPYAFPPPEKRSRFDFRVDSEKSSSGGGVDPNADLERTFEAAVEEVQADARAAPHSRALRGAVVGMILGLAIAVIGVVVVWLSGPLASWLWGLPVLGLVILLCSLVTFLVHLFRRRRVAGQTPAT